MTETSALIVAAGRGVRAGAGDAPKQYRSVGGTAVLRRTIDRFLAHPRISRVLVVIAGGDAERYASIAPQHDHLMAPVNGGATRQASVRAGLERFGQEPPGYILIHDAARPFASPALIGRVVDALQDNAAVVPTLAVADTVKSVDADGRIVGTVPREGLRTVATPQGFHFGTIVEAHNAALAAGQEFTDDAGIVEWTGQAVHAVEGDPANIKLTTSADIEAADRRLRGDEALLLGDVRVGTGYDVHAFGPGAEVMLGGVAIAHTRGVIGHSDADVALHALTDAELGAIAEGDIGDHFPPSDPQWKGASSDRFLRFAAERVRARGGVIGNLDLVIITQAPKIAPHRDAMRARIAEICGISPGRVGVKATTNENLGFIGRGEGIGAMATATVRLPFGSD